MAREDSATWNKPLEASSSADEQLDGGVALDENITEAEKSETTYSPSDHDDSFESSSSDAFSAQNFTRHACGEENSHASNNHKLEQSITKAEMISLL